MRLVMAVAGVLAAGGAWFALTAAEDPGGAGSTSPARSAPVAPAAIGSAPVAPSAIGSVPVGRSAIGSGPAPPSASGSAPAAVAAPCHGRAGTKLIRVSISQQRAWLCDGATLYLTTPVTTGADRAGSRTRLGHWHVQGAQTHRWLGGPGYSVRVRWWLPYDGDFGLHDAAWQQLPFGSPAWRAEGSHGCVHVPHDAMRRLYAWAPVGTGVTIAA